MVHLDCKKNILGTIKPTNVCFVSRDWYLEDTCKRHCLPKVWYLIKREATFWVQNAISFNYCSGRPIENASHLYFLFGSPDCTASNTTSGNPWLLVFFPVAQICYLEHALWAISAVQHHHHRHRHRHRHRHHRPQCPLPIANYRTIGQLGDQEANSAIAILHFCRNVYFCSISVLVLWWPKAKLPAGHYPQHSSFGPSEYFFLIGNLISVTICILFLSLFLENELVPFLLLTQLNSMGMIEKDISFRTFAMIF